MSLGSAIRRIAARVAADDAQTLPDAILVQRFVASKDEAAFAALTQRHAGTVLGVCRRALGHAQDAEDAAQAVFLAFAQHAASIRKPSAVAAWLHVVAVRVCRKARSRRQKRSAAVESFSSSTPSTAAADETVAWQDVRRVIDEALATLPEKLRVPLVLCYLQERTRDEAAEQLGWSLTTLRGRLERGRERLRTELNRRGFSLSAGLIAVLLTESAVSAAPHRWAVEAARTALHSPAITHPAVSLAHGVVPIMNRWLILTASVVLTGGLAAGLIWANTDDQPTPPIIDKKPPEASPKPDQKAHPTIGELRGMWAGNIPNPDNSVESISLRFEDGNILFWKTKIAKPGSRTSTTSRYTYAIKDGELTIYILEQYSGEEKLAIGPNNKEARGYTLTWTGPEKAELRLRQRLISRVIDFGWVETTIKRTEEAPEKSDPLVPEALRKIDRTIKKEPKYTDTPRYVLLGIGPEAKFKVWVVLDGTTLYVDRNGNGDLTDAGESIPIGLLLGVEPNPRNPAFLVGELTDPAGRKHTDFHFGAIKLASGSVSAKLGLRVDSKTFQTAGPTDLMLSDSPKDARVIHFDSRVVTARPSATLPATPDANQAVDFRVQIGTPGVGSGSFASYGSEQLADGVGPVAEIVFKPVDLFAEPKKLTLQLTERCCGDQFYSKLTVPDGVRTGLNAATVTLSFPNCPWGKVEPTTYTIDVIPKKK